MSLERAAPDGRLSEFWLLRCTGERAEERVEVAGGLGRLSRAALLATHHMQAVNTHGALPSI